MQNSEMAEHGSGEREAPSLLAEQRYSLGMSKARGLLETTQAHQPNTQMGKTEAQGVKELAQGQAVSL
jgi:hypothetical protein